MTLIEGIGDEVTHFFIGLLLVIVVTLAWWTTNISEQRHVQTAWLLDRRRHRRLTNHTHSLTVSEGIITETVNNDTNPIETQLPPMETTPNSNKASPSETAGPSDENAREEEGEQEQLQIVETMDSDTNNVVRQRRLAFYEKSSTSGNIEDNATKSEEIRTKSESDPTIMEHNYAERSKTEEITNPPNDPSDIRIKLKYINDDLKLVSGNLREQLGEFKRRHFQLELSTNKLVKLIFNGQVLQQDTKTLQNCGLFNDCVVHCLIHQRRTGTSDENGADNTGENGVNNRNHGNNNQVRDWDLGNFLFALISFTLLSAWYFRYVYAHLYTVTATVGLILMTGMFSFILFGAYFPDQEQIQQRRLDNTNT